MKLTNVLIKNIGSSKEIHDALLPVFLCLLKKVSPLTNAIFFMSKTTLSSSAAKTLGQLTNSHTDTASIHSIENNIKFDIVAHGN